MGGRTGNVGLDIPRIVDLRRDVARTPDRASGRVAGFGNHRRVARRHPPRHNRSRGTVAIALRARPASEDGPRVLSLRYPSPAHCHRRFPACFSTVLHSWTLLYDVPTLGAGSKLSSKKSPASMRVGAISECRAQSAPPVRLSLAAKCWGSQERWKYVSAGAEYVTPSSGVSTSRLRSLDSNRNASTPVVKRVRSTG